MGSSKRGSTGQGKVARWGAKQKERVVLRLLHGEPVDLVAREEGVTVARLTEWRDAFLAGGRDGLKSRRGDPMKRKLLQAERKIGELTMMLELLEGKDRIVRRGKRSKR